MALGCAFTLATPKEVVIIERSLRSEIQNQFTFLQKKINFFFMYSLNKITILP